MAALTGSTIVDTYTELLRMGNATLHATTGYYIKDSADTNSALSIAQTRVGIGTNTPAYHLEVAADVNPVIAIKNTDTSLSDGQEVGNILFRHSDSNADANNLSMGEIQVLAGQDITGTDDSPSSMSLGIVKDGTDTITKVLHLYSNGNVGIGVDDPDEVMEIKGTAGANTKLKLNVASLDADNEVCQFNACHNDGVMYSIGFMNSTVDPGDGGGSGDHNVAYSSMRIPASTASGTQHFQWLDKDGSIRTSTTNADIGNHTSSLLSADVSDERLKTISSDPFLYGLDAVNKLTPIKYKYNRPSSGPNEPDRLGFGAQSVESIIPEPVNHTGECLDGYSEDENGAVSIPKSDRMDKLNLDYNQFIPVLVKAVQELSAKVAALENA